MSKLSTIAFLYPGAMGASLAKTLHLRQPHLTLLTSIGSRSQATLDRSKASGLVDLPFPELIRRSDIIISILPPSSAVELAQSIISQLPISGRSTSPPIFIDANAISPGTVDELSKLFRTAGVPFIDGCVIGLPARDGHDPKIYLSCDSQYEGLMNECRDVLGGGGEGKGLKVEVLNGAGVGAASALKMCYGGISKGYTGLVSLMVLAANAHSSGTADALLHEFSLSKTEDLRNHTKTLPDMIGKAYRFVGEMEEISSFISSSLLPSSDTSAKSSAETGINPATRTIADTFQGIAQVFQRVADDLQASAVANGNSDEAGKDVKVLMEWSRKGKEAVAIRDGERNAKK